MTNETLLKSNEVDNIMCIPRKILHQADLNADIKLMIGAFFFAKDENSRAVLPIHTLETYYNIPEYKLIPYLNKLKFDKLINGFKIIDNILFVNMNMKELV